MKFAKFTEYRYFQKEGQPMTGEFDEAEITRRALGQVLIEVGLEIQQLHEAIADVQEEGIDNG